MDIVKLFRHRDEVFYSETKKILDDIAPVISGATEFIDEAYGMDANRDLVWEGVNLIDGIVTLVGVVSYTPGTKLMFEDELMDITEDNHEYFQQMIRIGVPMDIVISQSADVVYTYLVNLQKNEDSLADEQLEALDTDLADFDLTKLSEDQRASLLTMPQSKVVLN